MAIIYSFLFCFKNHSLSHLNHSYYQTRVRCLKLSLLFFCSGMLKFFSKTVTESLRRLAVPYSKSCVGDNPPQAGVEPRPDQQSVSDHPEEVIDETIGSTLLRLLSEMLVGSLNVTGGCLNLRPSIDDGAQNHQIGSNNNIKFIKLG